MNELDSILLLLDGSPQAAKALGCAVWLSAELGATLHILHSRAEPLPPAEAVARLRATEAQRGHVVLHQTTGLPERAVLQAIEEYAAKLVVMSARGESAAVGVDPQRSIGRTAQALLERSPVPILLIPVRYRESLPWRSMVVAASGEPAADQALQIAVRLSSALRLRATVVHVEERHTATPGRLVRYADAAHHEYPQRIEQMVRRAVACCSVEECRCIEEVLIRQGEPAGEFMGLLEQRGCGVLALGWHGALGATRAPVFRRLLELVECPLLVVRERPRSRARLKVGDELRGERSPR